uniref:Uncharacterized protein n=1 Tax=Arundo donax TaxID=35708 RepID=A0A0A9HIQ5_ARUDO
MGDTFAVRPVQRNRVSVARVGRLDASHQTTIDSAVIGALVRPKLVLGSQGG